MCMQERWVADDGAEVLLLCDLLDVGEVELGEEVAVVRQICIEGRGRRVYGGGVVLGV